MNKEVDIFIKKAKKWQVEIQLLRAILLECELEETLKWGQPCYVYNASNIVIIQAFKDHCDLGFFNGALLKDVKGLLVKAGENTQAGRQLRYTDNKEIVKQKSIIKSYIKEAISIAKTGKKMEKNEITATIIVEELEDLFKKNTAFKKAFELLTPGRKRGYLIYFSGAKQSETRITRINNYIPKIMCGKGIHDCTCGLSKRMPNCDGSHKQKK